MFINNRNAFSRKGKTILLFGLFLLLSASGCDLFASRDGQSSGGALSGIRIVYPQESAQFYVGDFVDIHAEINDPSGLTASVLTVNEEILRKDTFPSSVANGDLFQPWVPDAPGVYALQLLLEASTGGQMPSNIVNVYVAQAEENASEEPEPIEETEPEPEPELEECPEPIATTHSYANCRGGPGTAYNLVWGLKPDQSFPVLAKTPSGSWWKVRFNDSGVTCWIWGNLVDICGNKDQIPVDYTLEKDEIPQEESQTEPEEEPTVEPTKDGPTTS